jgi:hypothetical protein
MLGGALYRLESGGVGAASGKVSWKFPCREGVGLSNLGAKEGEALQGKAGALYLYHRATRPGGLLQVFSRSMQHAICSTKCSQENNL